MTQSEKRVPVSEYEALIASYPLFCLLSPENIHDLACRATEKYVESSTVITHEGAIVDGVYLILSGEAEVTRLNSSAGKKGIEHLAKLGPSDAIGLAETGFFSHNGIRTATVTAITSMVLLNIDIENFYSFLQEPSVPYPALKNVGEKILFMNSIRNLKLFRHLSSDALHHLATLVRKKIVKMDVTIFNEGDMADNCYFILSGRVAISKNAGQQLVSTLESPQMFGEDAFVLGGTRKASAQAEIDCELLVLEGVQVQKLLSEEMHESKVQSFIRKVRGAAKSKPKKSKPKKSKPKKS